MTKKTFHIGDVLCISTERMVSPRGVVAVYDVLEFLDGVRPYTIQIPRRMYANKQAVAAQLGPLHTAAMATIDQVKALGLDAWLAPLISRFGEYVEISKP